MRAFLDTNVLIRHFTGDPPDQAARATKLLASANELLVAHLIVAEAVYVLESFYELDRTSVAGLVRAVVAFPAVVVSDPVMVLRALEIYERQRLDFAGAYLVAQAERSGGVGAVASFDKAIDRVGTVTRIEPN
jgi:predicted nucleic acid-binding protein